ncbi:MAG: RNA-guided endonuclease InsQ/TnpB family protein [Promethearchaeota archaeon]
MRSTGGRHTYLTERIQLRPSLPISKLCHLAKNLYNLANYHIRQTFIFQGRWIRYGELYSLLKTTSAYRNLPLQTAQQVLRRLDQNWKAFFITLKDWKIHPEKYLGRPRLPRYKPKNGETLIIFTNQQCNIKNGLLWFPKKAHLLPIKTRIRGSFRHVRIIPKGNHYILEIVYEKNPIDLELDSSRVISIDLGLNNLVTVVNNAGLKPWRVKGGVIKSVNQYYNKERARLISIRDKQGLGFQTRRLQRLLLKRTNKIIDFFHKVSRQIISYCMVHGFGAIVVGYNPMWKQYIGLGKRINQNFVGIPFLTLVRQIKYKAKMVGIDLILVDESHTSKVSFLDEEPIKHQHSYIGKRIERGLFRSSKGHIINADVNGGYNIGRKAVPEAFVVDGIEGVGLHPDSVMV